MDNLETLLQAIQDTSKIEKGTSTITSNLDEIQKRIEANTSALQEFKTALTEYQATLSKSNSSDTSTLDNIKKILVVMDTIETATNKFKNVGRGKMFPLSHCYCFENADNNMCSLGY